MLAVSSQHLCANIQPHRAISMTDVILLIKSNILVVYVAGRLRHHQRCLHRFCHQLCGPDFPNRSTKCQPHLIFNLPRLKCLIHPVNIFHMMVSLLLHVSTPETLQRRIVTWEILESCLWLNKLLSFIPLFTRRPLIVPFCLVFRPSVTIQTLFPVSSCHCEEEFVPSRVACFSLSELTLTCGCERPRSTSGGGLWCYVCLESDWWEDWAALMLLLLLVVVVM